MPGEEELGEECSLSGDEKTCLIGMLLLLAVSRLFSLLSLRWSRIRRDGSHFLLELREEEEGEVRLDKQLHSAVEEEDLSIGNSKSSSGEVVSK